MKLLLQYTDLNLYKLPASSVNINILHSSAWEKNVYAKKLSAGPVSLSVCLLLPAGISHSIFCACSGSRQSPVGGSPVSCEIPLRWDGWPHGRVIKANSLQHHALANKARRKKKKKKSVKILRIPTSFMSQILRYGLVLFLMQKPPGAKQRDGVSV